ncbi:MAG: hypothetical protein J5831_02360, partial [Bacteroidales bacterium]|nr:hypothetical protein [Bacteroidales bacterium]
GAAWTFVAWGAFHGFFIVLEKMFKVKREHPSALGAGLSTLLTFFLVNLGWVLFRADSISKAFDYYKAMFSFRCDHFSLDAGMQFYVVLAVAVLFAFLTLFPFGKKIEQAVFYKKYNVAGHVAAWVVAVLLLFFCVASLNATGFSPFIYFRF